LTPKVSLGDRLQWWVAKLRGDRVIRDLSTLHAVIQRIDERADDLRELSDAELQAKARDLAQRVPDRRRDEGDRIAMFALVREAAHRTLGLWAFEAQLMAAWAVSGGGIAQMDNGAGKTLVAVFAAVHSALLGARVHVWTANDYLARRDAAWMEPVYEFFGLRVAAAGEDLEAQEKRVAYEADVTYVSANELGFDFLRDRMQRERDDGVLQPFECAILDEIDSILIDEARIPLVLAGSEEGVEENLERFSAAVERLVPGRDFEVDARAATASFTDDGARLMEAELGVSDLYAGENLADLTAANRALLARAIYERDVDYLVRDGRVLLVDDLKGRTAARRRWPDGLQEAIEAKEGLSPSDRGRILNTITLQHLVSLYPRISGMTATAESAADEFHGLYGLEVFCIPPNVPCQRVDHPDVFFTHVEARDEALVEEIAAVHSTGRPIMVGTSSVEESERLAQRLRDRGISLQLLNARYPEREAQLIAEAGALGAVTISTNMAGRGTDIALGGAAGRDREAVVALSGLYVLGTRRHDSVRIDRQLRGRAGRQGDPGASRFYVHLGDETVELFGLRDMIPRRYTRERFDHPIESPRVEKELDRAQRICEGQLGEQRRCLARYADVLEGQRRLTFEFRDQVVAGEIPRLLEQYSEERAVSVSREFGSDVLDEVERVLILAQIDRAWSEHLARMAELRELVPLLAVGSAPSVMGLGWMNAGREPPVTIYEREARESFREFHGDWEAGVIDVFEGARITEAGIDLEPEGLREPGATWTYLLTDRPVEPETPQPVRDFRSRWIEWRERMSSRAS
jgi:preprotein translocase subunit SecA